MRSGDFLTVYFIHHLMFAELCYNIERLPVIIRNREPGDKIANKLVSDFLTKYKIPYLTKKNILLLCDEDNKVLAVLGYKGGK